MLILLNIEYNRPTYGKVLFLMKSKGLGKKLSFYERKSRHLFLSKLINEDGRRGPTIHENTPSNDCIIVICSAP